MNKSKTATKWYLSKGVWLGVIAIAISGITAIDQGLSWTQALLAAFGTAAIVVRGITKLPLGK